MKPDVFWVQKAWEPDPWELDVGATLNFARWGLGFTADYLGRHAPNAVTLHIGPLTLWITLWNWSGLSRNMAGE